MTDVELEWIVTRWQSAIESGNYDDWRTLLNMMHAAWMASYKYSREDATIYEVLVDIAQTHYEEKFMQRCAA